MTKFKAGDQVMFKHCSETKSETFDTDLNLFQPQIVEGVYNCNIKIKGDYDYWSEDLWEPFEEWAKHQKAVQELTYTDCNGDTKPLDRFHLHELVDRIHCVRVMLKHLLQNHPAGHLVAEELEAAQEKLGDAYQKAGEISFDKFKE